MKQQVIKNTEFNKHNCLRAQGYVTSWVGNGFICMVKPIKN